MSAPCMWTLEIFGTRRPTTLLGLGLEDQLPGWWVWRLILLNPLDSSGGEAKGDFGYRPRSDTLTCR